MTRYQFYLNESVTRWTAPHLSITSDKGW